MSHDHGHNNHSNESKPVSFTVPFIMASVTLVIIFLFLSLCDPKKHESCECKENCSKECMEACEKGDHSLHPKEDVVIVEGHSVDVKDTVTIEAASETTDSTNKATEQHH